MHVHIYVLINVSIIAMPEIALGKWVTDFAQYIVSLPEIGRLASVAGTQDHHKYVDFSSLFQWYLASYLTSILCSKCLTTVRSMSDAVAQRKKLGMQMKSILTLKATNSTSRASF